VQGTYFPKTDIIAVDRDIADGQGIEWHAIVATFRRSAGGASGSRLGAPVSGAGCSARMLPSSPAPA
jgi:hypothetical protein